jgi:RNA polymerase sigma-70 factor (ECF subfamily)
MVEREADFDALFSETFPSIVRFAERRLADPNIAEDIAAVTFAAAWEECRRGSVVSRAWLYRVAANKLADYYRSLGRQDELQVAVARSLEEPAEGLSHLDRLAVREAIQRLSTRDREVVLLTYWDGLNAREIASVLECRPAVVWTALSRSRKRLRQELSVQEERRDHHAR